jgi:hypothetical protein
MNHKKTTAAPTHLKSGTPQIEQEVAGIPYVISTFCIFLDYSCFLTLLQCWDVEKNEEKIKTNFAHAQ